MSFRSKARNERRARDGDPPKADSPDSTCPKLIYRSSLSGVFSTSAGALSVACRPAPRVHRMVPALTGVAHGQGARDGRSLFLYGCDAASSGRLAGAKAQAGTGHANLRHFSRPNQELPDGNAVKLGQISVECTLEAADRRAVNAVRHFLKAHQKRDGPSFRCQGSAASLTDYRHLSR